MAKGLLRSIRFLQLLLCLAAPALALANPFGPYLTRRPPEVVRNLGEETRDDVRIQRLVFFSRTASTPNGPVRSEVFAFVVRPVQPGRYPGILLLHGGGGAAQEDSAIYWAKRGFVVVAPDLPGIANPEKVPDSSGAWKQMAYGKNHFLVTPDVTASGIFDGVLAAVQALYLLRAQPDVDRNRVGVTGVSWGGYTTIMVAGLARKDVRAAYAIYGSGFFDLGSAFQQDLAKLPQDQSAEWLAQLDAQHYAPDIKARFFEASATNDTYFWPPAVSATLAEIHSAKNQVLAPNADHWMDIPGGCDRTAPGVPHDNSWMAMQDIYFEYMLKGQGSPFPEVKDAEIDKNTHKVRFRVKHSVGAAEVGVYYSPTETPWKTRKWLQVKAERRGRWYEAQVPANVDWFASITDSRPVTVTSEIHLAIKGALGPAS
jgi:dienelactone hydrolase